MAWLLNCEVTNPIVCRIVFEEEPVARRKGWLAGAAPANGSLAGKYEVLQAGAPLLHLSTGGRHEPNLSRSPGIRNQVADEVEVCQRGIRQVALEHLAHVCVRVAGSCDFHKDRLTRHDGNSGVSTPPGTDRRFRVRDKVLQSIVPFLNLAASRQSSEWRTSTENTGQRVAARVQWIRSSGEQATAYECIVHITDDV